jgi:hypothetical protein
LVGLVWLGVMLCEGSSTGRRRDFHSYD